MHAWDCGCGTRNAPVFARCRACGSPIARGRPVAGDGPPAIVPPPAPATLARERNPAAAGWIVGGLILAGFVYPLAWLFLVAWGFAIIVEAAWVSTHPSGSGPGRRSPTRQP